MIINQEELWADILWHLTRGQQAQGAFYLIKREILYQNHQKNMNRFIRKKAGLSTIRWRYGHHSLVLPLKLWQWLMFRQMILKQSELQIREKRQLYGIKRLENLYTMRLCGSAEEQLIRLKK